MLTAEQQSQFISFLIDVAKTRPDNSIQFMDQQGATVATFTAHRSAVRPKDMPRHLRPKQKLSKRTRDAAKREKLDANRVAAPVG